MIVLVCNVGSTSLKFKLFDMPGSVVLSQGKIERIGSAVDAIVQYVNKRTGADVYEENQNIPDYRTGINIYINYLLSKTTGVLEKIGEIERVGFKTVLSKGYYGVHELTEPVMNGMVEWMNIAPLHNRSYLEAIRTLREVLPDAMFIGAFETAFHQTIPLERRMYGIPYEWYAQYGIQRMGYHGASHSYIADVLRAQVGEEYRAISCHLGGSSSICAIENGKSVNTSFGMSLQSGIIHANRVGDMDCDLIMFLQAQGLDLAEINNGIKNKGGLLGISGVSGDLRYIEEAAAAGNDRAKLAIDVLVNAIVNYIGAYYAHLGGLDHLVFTGGIGENSVLIRRLVCSKLKHLGIILSDIENNQCSAQRTISEKESRVKIQVIPANEELGIAKQTFEFSN
jgi:acetate kinase